MRIYDAGRCRLDGTSLLYLVTEYAEEDLSQILPQRALTPSEATDMLPPLLDTLAYLHSKGFVHGRIKPSNVHATEDQLKLSADEIVPWHGEGAMFTMRPKRQPESFRPRAMSGPLGSCWSPP
jgi:serine/threonine protein kinase